jgi:hypothetical protein
VCSVEVGSKAWVSEVAKACKARPGKNCGVPSCGQASVSLVCREGRCVRQ